MTPRFHQSLPLASVGSARTRSVDGGGSKGMTVFKKRRVLEFILAAIGVRHIVTGA